MLIVSKFHDYYDSIMSVGIDKQYVYNRTTSIVSDFEISNLEIMPYPSNAKTKNEDVLLSPVLIGFAGKIYPAVHVTKVGDSRGKFLFSSDEYNNFVQENEIKLKKGYTFFRRQDINSEKASKDFFNKDYKILDGIFVTYNVPVFVIDLQKNQPKLTLNPNLKELDFVRVKDPFTAFQEIFMYKAGVLGNPEKEILTISDKDKAKQYGHDGKYSFKKPKEK